MLESLELWKFLDAGPKIKIFYTPFIIATLLRHFKYTFFQDLYKLNFIIMRISGNGYCKW